MATKQIVILGGGFGGVYAARKLDSLFSEDETVEITLVNQENFMLFTPMLHEVAASDLDATDIVNPINKLLKKTKFFCGSVDSIDLSNKTVTVNHGNTYHSHELTYDHLILALGSVTNFYGLPGLAENSLTMKSLGDAIHLRNQMISLLEEANFECCKHVRAKLLTFVVAGGGFAGVETIAAMNDFLVSVLKYYPNLSQSDLRVILVNSGQVLLPELNQSLGEYAGKLMEKRGVEIHYEKKVSSYQNGTAELTDGTKIESCTLVWTAGSSPNPLIKGLSLTQEKGRILVNEKLQSVSDASVWSCGDSAAIPDGIDESGKPIKFHPPTAQHAIREASVLANNIYATLKGGELKKFRFRTLGLLASLGHRKGVAQILGINFSGFIAWFLWRSIYLMKLPRIEKRVRVALSWTLDLIFSKDNVQLPISRAPTMRVPLTEQV